MIKHPTTATQDSLLRRQQPVTICTRHDHARHTTNRCPVKDTVVWQSFGSSVRGMPPYTLLSNSCLRYFLDFCLNWLIGDRTIRVMPPSVCIPYPLIRVCLRFRSKERWQWQGERKSHLCLAQDLRVNMAFGWSHGVGGTHRSHDWLPLWLHPYVVYPCTTLSIGHWWLLKHQRLG